jgi:hypothetical protein
VPRVPERARVRSVHELEIVAAWTAAVGERHEDAVERLAHRDRAPEAGRRHAGAAREARVLGPLRDLGRFI